MTAGSKVFDFMENLSPEHISGALKGEPALVGAVVAANLNPTLTAKVLACVTLEERKEIIANLPKARKVAGDLLGKVSKNLRAKLSSNTPLGQGGIPQAWKPRSVDEPAVTGTNSLPDSRREDAINKALQQANITKGKFGAPAPISGKTRKVDGMALAAEILRNASPEVRHLIQDDSPELFANLKQRMFTFEDLMVTPVTSLGEVANAVDSKTLGLALRFASDELHDRMLAAVSKRHAIILQAEMDDTSGRVRMSDIENAQQDVINAAMKLQQAGKILIDPSDPDLA